MWHKLYKAIFLPLKCLEVLTFCPLNCQLVFKVRASKFLAFNRLTLISWFFKLVYHQQAGLDFEAGHLKCCPWWWYPIISIYYARRIALNSWPLIMIPNILSILKFLTNSILENSLSIKRKLSGWPNTDSEQKKLIHWFYSDIYFRNHLYKDVHNASYHFNLSIYAVLTSSITLLCLWKYFQEKN